MIADFNTIKNKILDVKYGRLKEGLKIGVLEIDEYLRFKPSNFNLIVGHANVGKTTVILYLMTVYAIKHNIKWLVFSSENLGYSIARKILEFKSGRAIQEMNDEEIEFGLGWVYQNFKIIDVNKSYTYKILLAEALEIKNTFDYSGFLIDPYNSLSKDKELIKSVGSHEYDYEVSTIFRLFCKEHNVSIWLNSHAVTESLRRTHPVNHKFQNLPVPPNGGDTEGGGKWNNRADDVITIHRYTQHPTEWMWSEIHIRKVKEVESGGRPTPYDEPIKLKMMRNNIGFECNNIDLIANLKPRVKKEIPF